MPTRTEPFPKREADLRAAFWKQVSSFAEGHRIKNCLQCGTCTGTCPVSYAMDITPRQIIALFRAGMMEDILESRSIWLCASCYSCTVRCPADIKVTDTLYSLKRIAMERKIYPPKFPVHTLSEAFVKNVYKYGRNYELGLGLRYFLKTDFVKLFSNIGYGVSMIARGRLGLLPRKLKRVNQIRAIITRANEFGEG
ncbi:MAG TPA: 4Fe-4S dicluster domain-containing protein [Candidatus Deferrimicrobium sp.]|nr:4Fe-4S dicluster domain-containing protein [Candidatus Deferrimicrobium sp.]